MTAALGALVVAGTIGGVASAQGPGRNTTRPLKINQTEGFAVGQNQVFTYTQNFHCTIEPFDDLDGIGRQGDGTPAAADPDEMIFPECISGETRGGAEPTIDPAGRPMSEARKFWAIVPTFDANGNGIPEGVDPNPGVQLQCPAPGPPTTEHKEPFGSCTMHPSFVFVDPILPDITEALAGLRVPNPLDTIPRVPTGPPVDSPVALPTVGPGVLVPLPSHSHIVETTNDDALWWQVIVVLVKDRSIWPDLDGNCPAGRERCLTSLEALRDSQAATTSGRDIPTNIWLFFHNQPENLGPAPDGKPMDPKPHGMHH